MRPTPAKIARTCERIRQAWKPAEVAHRRAGLMPGTRRACGDVTVRNVIPVIPLNAEMAAALNVAS